MILNEKGWFIAQQTPVTMKHVDLTMTCWFYHQKGRFRTTMDGQKWEGTMALSPKINTDHRYV